MTAIPATVRRRDEQSLVRIDVQGVKRSFISKRRVVDALGPIDLQIEDDEFICIVGPSGCGKSTLLRIMAGLIPPSAGVVELRSPTAESSKTAMVFQNYSIFPWKTVLDNIRFGLDLEGVPKAQGNARAHEWIETLGLSGFADAYPATLSGGMQQRVAIARAFAVEPHILLMDEPFAALDAQMRLLLQEVLLNIWQNDRRTVAFVTHSIEEALLLGDRVIVMSNQPGSILADIPVTFPRPRTAALRGSAEFASLHEEVWTLLRREAVKAH